jgi:hypothetical protein
MVRFEGHNVTRCVLLTRATTVAVEIADDKEGIKGSNALSGVRPDAPALAGSSRTTRKRITVSRTSQKPPITSQPPHPMPPP